MSNKLDDLLKDLGMSLDEFGGDDNDTAAPLPARSATNRSTAYNLEEDMVQFLESFGDDNIDGFGNSPTISVAAENNNAGIAYPPNQLDERLLENTDGATDSIELTPMAHARSSVTGEMLSESFQESMEEQRQQEDDSDSAIKSTVHGSNNNHLENINVVADESTVDVGEPHIETLEETIQEIKVADTEMANNSQSITASETLVSESAQVVVISREVSEYQTEEINAALEEETVPNAPKVFKDEIVQIISEDLVSETEAVGLSRQQNVLESTNSSFDENIVAVEAEEGSTAVINQTENLAVTETIDVAETFDVTLSHVFIVKEEKQEGVEVEQISGSQIIALGSESSDDSVIEVSKDEEAQIETILDFVYEIVDSTQFKDETDAPTDVEIPELLQQITTDDFQTSISEKAKSQEETEVYATQLGPQESTFVTAESQQNQTPMVSVAESQYAMWIEETKSQQETAVTDFENYEQPIQESAATIYELPTVRSKSQEFSPEFVIFGLQNNEAIVEDNFSADNNTVLVGDSQDADTIIEIPATIEDPAPIIKISAITVIAATVPIEDPSNSPPPVPSKSSSPIPQTVVIGPRSSSVARRSNETELLTPTKSPSRERALSSTQSDVDLEYNNNHTPTSSGSELDNDIQVQIIRIKGQIERTRILINEQLRLRNMQPLLPGQLTLPAPAPVQMQGLQESVRGSKKRDSLISNVLQRVTSVTSLGPSSPPSPAPPATPTQAEEIRAMREKLEAARKEVAEKMAVNQALLAAQQQQQQQRQQQQQQTPHNRSNSLKQLPTRPTTISQPESATAHQNEPTSPTNVGNGEFPGVHKSIEINKKDKNGGGETSSITSGKSGKSGKSTAGGGWGGFFGRKSSVKLRTAGEESAKSPAPTVPAVADPSVAVAVAKKKKNINPDALINNPSMMMYGGGMGGGFRY
ncbi:hypothetical protein HK100_005593 [Physocladia obscura]|uniref:Uncharacterized protein n=1 Tax=Physocladia obscura TaxID=109957 RepID=A0AAD5T6F2_9FUNG|nr:hypothetical protein HK100_005593 [Physocladia obscura]